MIKQGRFILVAMVVVVFLSGCLGSVWTGATMVYDRHNVYKKLNDYHLLADVNNVLSPGKFLRRKDCSIDIATFNGDILLAGHVPSEEIRNEIILRLKKVKGYRRLYNEITIQETSAAGVQDSWITTKIRSQIFADDAIDPNAFKVITSDQIVYLMGDVKKDQADKVIEIARFTNGVERVVKILNYFTYQAPKNMA